MSDAKFAMTLGAAIFIAFVASLIFTGIEQNAQQQMRFEQCIAAWMQWNNGDCLK